MKRFHLLSLVLVFGVSCYAQDKTIDFFGYVMQELENGVQSAVEDAHVTLIVGKDTLHTMSANGAFKFSKVRICKVKLIVSHIGLRTYEKEIDLLPKERWFQEVIMVDQDHKLKEVTVLGRIPIYKLIKDTLIYNPKAVHIAEDDVVLNLIEQFPGVEVSDLTLKILGKEVRKAYVDGRLLFGTNPMNALNYLSANDVLTIKAYDEYENTTTTKKTHQGNVNRVIDIETKSKLVNSWNLHLLASAGSSLNADTLNGSFRYGAGATANFFSENFLFSANAFHNNMHRKSNNVNRVLSLSSPDDDYVEKTYGDLATEKMWNGENNASHGAFALSYSFNLEQRNNASLDQRHYFPDALYSNRTYEEYTINRNRKQEHYTNLSLSHANDKWGSVSWNHNFNYLSDKYASHLSLLNRVNEQQTKGVLQHDDADKGYFVNENISYQNDIADRLLYTLNGSYTYKKNSDFSSRIDTLDRTNTTICLSIPTRSKFTTYNGKVVMYYYMGHTKDNVVSFEYDITHEKGFKHQIAWNMQNPLYPTLDEVNTYTYDVNNNVHLQKLSFRLYLLKKMQCSLSAGIKESTIKFVESDYTPVEKEFISPMASFSLQNFDFTNRWIFDYNLNSLLPNAVQLRTHLDNSNPFLLRTGNPHLRQSLAHHFQFSYHRLFNRTHSSLQLRVAAMLRQHSLVTKTTYYPTETYLPDYRYTLPAHSTLISFDNINGAWNLNSMILWQMPIQKIKSKYELAAHFLYNQQPYYIGEAKVITRSYQPKMGHTLKFRLSRNFSFNLLAESSYTQSTSSNSQRVKSFSQSAGFNLNIHEFLKYFYFDSRYHFYYSQDLGIIDLYNRNHILNFKLGCKLFKRKADFSFIVYDILNSFEKNKVKVLADYIQNSRQSYNGRFFSFNFVYKFGKIKSSFNGATNDGNERVYLPNHQ